MAIVVVCFGFCCFPPNIFFTSYFLLEDVDVGFANNMLSFIA